MKSYLNRRKGFGGISGITPEGQPIAFFAASLDFCLLRWNLRTICCQLHYSPPIDRSHQSGTMSLFGSSPDDPSPAANASSQQKSSLFADEAPKPKASGGLFNDESANGESPWDMPSSKRASKGDPAKTLLPSSDVPESYIDAYDLLNASEGGNVSLNAARKLVGGSSIAPQDAEQILNLVSGGHKNPNLGRNEFNLLLALVGLAEEGDELSLDTVDERRKSERLFS